MSLSPQTRKRLPNIKAGLLRGDNYTTIGGSCGVTERTIDRDTKAWFASEDFENWIKTQWIELHGRILAEDPTEAYRQISRLVTKMITQRQEIRTEGRAEIITKHIEELNVTLGTYEDAVQKVVRRYIREDRPKQPLDTTQTTS